MSKDNVVEMKKPDVFVNDPITETVRNGARQSLAKALEAEISLFINQYKDLIDDLGRHRVVRMDTCLNGRSRPVLARFR